MISDHRHQEAPLASGEASPGVYFIDLAVYLSVMFLIRQVYVSSLGFITNGLFWSVTTLAVATWIMKARGVRWSELGLRKSTSLNTSVVATLSIFVLAIGSVIVLKYSKTSFTLDSHQTPPMRALSVSSETSRAIGRCFSQFSR